ncbi:MAG TPA: alpha/beta hydrolase [Propionibacteriaceae bacterium]|nr:alpha/beta hydrolase [Propionibacteriaceae bacterium]
MSIGHTVVLLPGMHDTSTQTTAVKTPLANVADVAQVLTPDIKVSRSKPVILEDPAQRVLGALSAAGIDRAVLIGHGWGSMVALEIAATRGERVTALMLSTNARLETIVLRSLYYGVLNLLPATVVQRLGARPPDVLNLFDQVRPADFRPLAERIRVPALVVVGEQDVANRGPSATLAKFLPLGNLRVVPRTGAGWRAQPEVVAQLLVEFLSSMS